MSTAPAQKRTRTIERGTSALPTARVNRIIKADQDVNLCSKEAIFLIAKATERMIEEMSLQAHAAARLQKRNKLVKYSDLASTASQGQWYYLGEVIPAPIPLKTAKALRQQNDDVANAPSATAAGGSGEQVYEGKRVVKGKKRASLAAAAAAGGDLEVAEKRQTRGKQLKYTGADVGGDEEDEDDEEADFGGNGTSEAGDMDVDD